MEHFSEDEDPQRTSLQFKPVWVPGSLPKPPIWKQGWFCMLVSVVVWTLLAYGFLFVTRAYAHEWFTDKKDPVTLLGCCGGYDCAEIDDTDVRKQGDGYVYVPTGEYIPRERIQQSETFRFARCVYQSSFQSASGWHEAGTTRCFFEPSGF